MASKPKTTLATSNVLDGIVVPDGDADIVGVVAPEAPKGFRKKRQDDDIAVAAKWTTVNLSVHAEEKEAFAEWCHTHRMSQVQVWRLGFELVRKQLR